MGGGVSRFDETDWDAADGQLIGHDATVDGAPPTDAYGVYYITKRNVVNQREFDVTDQQHNLLYSVRAVPGTIASFDVLRGCGTSVIDDVDDRLLRVSVDLARRYWIVHRYNVPSFMGQQHDPVASHKVCGEIEEEEQCQLGGSSGSGRNDVTPTTTPSLLLYRRACITVSWSRYLAVTTLYRPPSTEQLERYFLDASSSAASADDENDDELFNKAAQVAVRRRSPQRKNSSGEDWNGTTNDMDTPQDNDDKDGDLVVQPNVIPSSHSMPGLASDADDNDAPSLPSFSSFDHEIPSSSTASMKTTLHHPGTAASSRAGTAAAAHQLSRWLSSQSQSLANTTRHLTQSSVDYFHTQSQQRSEHKQAGDPRQGVLPNLRRDDDDTPVLVCQEIYNRLIGNHQTFLVGPERLQELLRLDQQDKNKRDGVQQHDTTPDHATTTTPDPSSPGRGVEESKCADVSSKLDGDSSSTANINGRHAVTPTGTSRPASPGAQQQQQQQPTLIGYWNWEHSLRNQRVKLHLGKNADLALHVVLAVVVNQVRVERHALAMAI